MTHPGQKAPPAADHPPLTVMVLAPVAWISDHAPVSWLTSEPLHDNVREDRYAMVVLGTLVVFLVGLLGRRASAVTPSVSSPPASRPSRRTSGSTTDW